MSDLLPPAWLKEARRQVQSALPDLWPEFDPGRIPLLFFGGGVTHLSGAMPQEPGWEPAEGGWVWPGRHPALTAGTALDEVLRARLGTSPLPFPTPALMEAEAAQLATCETKTRLVTRLDAFRGLPGTRLSLKSQVPLQVVGFDPLNLHVLPDGSYLHARYLRLSGPAVELEVLGGQALAHGPGPLTVTDLEVAGLPADLTPTLEAGRWCLKGEVLSVQVSQSCVTRDGAGGWHLHF